MEKDAVKIASFFYIKLKNNIINRNILYSMDGIVE